MNTHMTYISVDVTEIGYTCVGYWLDLYDDDNIKWNTIAICSIYNMLIKLFLLVIHTFIGLMDFKSHIPWNPTYGGAHLAMWKLDSYPP